MSLLRVLHVRCFEKFMSLLHVVSLANSPSFAILSSPQRPVSLTMALQYIGESPVSCRWLPGDVSHLQSLLIIGCKVRMLLEVACASLDGL